VKSLQPFVLRGLFSIDFSFNHEVALATIVMAVFIFILLLSFIVYPAVDNDHAKYQALLVVTYTPLLALTHGSLYHCLSLLSYSIPTTPGIFFDCVVDSAFLTAILLHVFFARFRALPLPKQPLSVGLFPKLKVKDMFLLENSPSSSSSLSSSSNKSESTLNKDKEVLGDGWEKCYIWRSGLTYYENPDKGELMYDDGGAGAIFEETDIDLVKLGDGVYLGPSFKVIVDRSEEFLDMWGQSFQKRGSHNKPGDFTQQDLESVLDAALSNEYCWIIALLYALVTFLSTAGSFKAYHTFSALGVSAALVGLLHFRHSSS
jgi:hypothetical protein